jgi:Holliday junction resolvase RusA-like endonuclease
MPADRTMLVLPMPPSANNLFFNIPGGRGRAKSGGYKAWITEAGLKLKAQRPLKLLGDVEVHYRFGPRNRSADVENRIKPVSDLLVAHGVIKDDRFIVRLVVEWAGDVRGVEVTVIGFQGELLGQARGQAA